MPTREQQVLELIRENPMLSQQAIADRLGISRSAVAGHVMKLGDKGLIKGRGYVLGGAPFVALVGGANVDIHGRAAGSLRARDSNPGSVQVSAGGVARNIAENLARLGVDCRLVSAVGDDHNGRLLLRLSREAGIDTAAVLVADDAATSTYLSVIGPDGDMQVAINDMRIMDSLTPERLQAREAMLRQAALVVIDCNLPEAALAWLADTLSGRTLFADTVSAAKAPRLRACLRNIHTLKTSPAEAETLTGLPARSHAELSEVARWLHAEGVRRVFVTRGDAGVFFSTAEARGLTKPGLAGHTVANAGGAGDAFVAGLAYGWLEDLSLDESLQYALAAAEITLATAATSNPALSLAAIERHLESPHD